MRSAAIKKCNTDWRLQYLENKIWEKNIKIGNEVQVRNNSHSSWGSC